MRMRTIDGCIAVLKESDPNTAITKTWLRRMVVTGKIPSVTVGKKYLIDADALDGYIAGKMTDSSTKEKTAPGIRTVTR